MDDISGILSEFTRFTSDSYVFKLAQVAATQPATPGSTTQEQAGQTSSSPLAGQPSARVNETNAIATQPAPMTTSLSKIPTSNAAPAKHDFTTYT